MTLREHNTDHIGSLLMFVKDKNSTGGFEREKKYYTKIERSIKNKKKEDKLRLAMLQDNNGKRTEAVDINLKDIRHKQRDMLKYYDVRIRERSEKVAEVRQVLREDVDTRKELTMLRKAD